MHDGDRAGLAVLLSRSHSAGLEDRPPTSGFPDPGSALRPSGMTRERSAPFPPAQRSSPDLSRGSNPPCDPLPPPMDCRDEPGNDRGERVDHHPLSIVIPAASIDGEPGSGRPGLATALQPNRPGSPIPDNRLRDFRDDEGEVGREMPPPAVIPDLIGDPVITAAGYRVLRLGGGGHRVGSTALTCVIPDGRKAEPGSGSQCPGRWNIRLSGRSGSGPAQANSGRTIAGPASRRSKRPSPANVRRRPTI